MVANIAMLGFFTGQTDVITAEAMKKAILGSVPKGTGELNTNAFELGFQYQPEETAVAAGA
jgi:2-oxoglutarate ferredoxin oxidoreductase subunit gamma